MRDDGGPAFPTTNYYDERPYGITDGISTRDYFAAHAPKHYASWFSPVMAPRPLPKYDHEHPSDRCGFDTACDPVNGEELSAYDDERRAQYERQWPYAYADAMLIERKR